MNKKELIKESNKIPNLHLIGFKNFMTKKGCNSLKNALEIFGSNPHTKEEYESDPTIVMKLFDEAQGYIEETILDMINFITRNYINKNGIFNKNPLDIFVNFGKLINKIYPEFSIEGYYFSEAYVINHIIDRLSSYLFSIVALKEEEHMKYKKGGKYIHESFFQAYESRGLLPIGTSLLLEKYKLIKEIIIPFLKETDFNLKEEISGKKLKELNDYLAKKIIDNQSYTIPMCIMNNSTISKTKEYDLKFASVGPETGNFPISLAQVGYLNKEIGNLVKDNLDAQSNMKIKRHKESNGCEIDVVISLGGFDPLIIDRFTGDLHFQGIGKESLKKITGNPSKYELIRYDILWYLAQIICKRSILRELFGDDFKIKKRGQNKKQKLKDLSSGRDLLIFPRSGITDLNERFNYVLEIIRSGNYEGELDDKIKDEIEQIQEKKQIEKKNIKGGHKRLLPLNIKSQLNEETGEYDIIITSSMPSSEAIKKAELLNINLGIGIEFSNIKGAIFYPEDLDFIYKKIGVDNLDDCINYFKNKGVLVYKRYETFVGDMNTLSKVSRKASAKVSKIINGNL